MGIINYFKKTCQYNVGISNSFELNGVGVFTANPHMIYILKYCQIIANAIPKNKTIFIKL